MRSVCVCGGGEGGVNCSPASSAFFLLWRGSVLAEEALRTSQHSQLKARSTLLFLLNSIISNRIITYK